MKASSTAHDTRTDEVHTPTSSNSCKIFHGSGSRTERCALLSFSSRFAGVGQGRKGRRQTVRVQPPPTTTPPPRPLEARDRSCKTTIYVLPC